MVVYRIGTRSAPLRQFGNRDQKSVQLSAEIQFHFVDVAPTPGFAGLEGFHDRVMGRVKMFRRMFVLRRVATADMTAFETQPEMHPAIAHLQALFAPVGCAWSNVPYLIKVCTGHHILHLRIVKIVA